MARLRIYHNPGCSKSRGALELLRGRGAEVEVVEYLRQPPDRPELEALLRALPDAPEALVRKDGHFRELGLDPADCRDPDSVLDLLLSHPRLMQRPVVLRGERAVIGRPPERVLELLEEEA